jgi:hypothetical protein
MGASYAERAQSMMYEANWIYRDLAAVWQRLGRADQEAEVLAKAKLLGRQK